MHHRSTDSCHCSRRRRRAGNYHADLCCTDTAHTSLIPQHCNLQPQPAGRVLRTNDVLSYSDRKYVPNANATKREWKHSFSTHIRPWDLVPASLDCLGNVGAVLLQRSLMLRAMLHAVLRKARLEGQCKSSARPQSLRGTNGRQLWLGPLRQARRTFAQAIELNGLSVNPREAAQLFSQYAEERARIIAEIRAARLNWPQELQPPEHNESQSGAVSVAETEINFDFDVRLNNGFVLSPWSTMSRESQRSRRRPMNEETRLWLEQNTMPMMHHPTVTRGEYDLFLTLQRRMERVQEMQRLQERMREVGWT
ncbi:hypothetical protein BAUCODRAFT_503364 [Baudoinia panamericana UAMH 10762]|uniref:Uncharacterized protein n=1 Tax=Baudoinia panamericana (strain UAMH 10762) TaxID=717646 RepID=M2MGL7_BAUPA|nr:uncharacterized protein BAUCODRAFT_503364 [Baudoinia panamericana UAMH 10762]EMC95776.1 hypothetical protein BAUCODRAFT_503364 [Baudoinia panamericana UAMH 10762]